MVLALALAAIAFGTAASAPAQTETTIYNFGATGAPAYPYGGFTLDSGGNLYGTTSSGGANRSGTVYKLALVSGAWQETTLYSFTGGADGGSPYAPPIFDAKGNLYGTASIGGAYKAGVIYELTPATGGGWQQTVLYSFTGGLDGGYSFGNLVFDKTGNLYGSNAEGGPQPNCQGDGSGCGVIFELSPSASGKWHLKVLHTFTAGWDGVGPASLTFDASGNLFGSAPGAWGGFEAPNGPGLVFELTPGTGGPWRDSIVYAFRGAIDGGLPSGIIFDAAGNMYGAGADGGILDNCYSGYGPIGCGVVFKISPIAGGKWKETTLYAFQASTDGSQPDGGVVFDNGKLYGSTFSGAIYELSQAANGDWHDSTAYNFDGTNGSIPEGTLVVDAEGNLYGMTVYGGENEAGIAFELTP